MVWKRNWGNDSEETKELAYDLRQGYAKLLNTTLERIKEYREERDYKNWFEELDGLFIDISMKLSSGEKDEYQRLLKDLNEEIQKNPQAYTNKNLESNIIYTKLKLINMWLLQKMEDYSIFGSKIGEDDEY